MSNNGAKGDIPVDYLFKVDNPLVVPVDKKIRIDVYKRQTQASHRRADGQLPQTAQRLGTTDRMWPLTRANQGCCLLYTSFSAALSFSAGVRLLSCMPIR